MTAEQIPSAELKACCATAYERDVVALVLGPSFHPGGNALTRRLANRLQLCPGQRVLDVASGPGTTAMLLAAEYDVRVDGIEYSIELAASAASRADAASLGGTVAFHVGDAERLPFDDDTFDVVICECAFCIFPDKPRAAAEFARVLRPHGRLGITDVTVRSGELPASLAGLAGTIGCLADARSLDEYLRILDFAGFGAAESEDHRQALIDMVDRIEARLTVLGMLRPAKAAIAGIDVPRVLELTRVVTEAINEGVASYALVTAICL